MDKWFLNNVKATLLYQDSLLIDTDLVTQGFSTILGGVSAGYYNSLNLAFHVGDEQALVNQNRSIFSQALGIDKKDWIVLNQVHSDMIVEVSASHRGKGASSPLDVLADADAMITNIPGTPLITLYADCIPIYILDPIRKAIGLAHAGWKGTCGEIGVKTIAQMGVKYGTVGGDCLVAIGPGIGACCYEVQDELAQLVSEAFPYYAGQICKPGDSAGRYMLNLPELNRLQFIEMGVNPSNISLAECCTKCNQHLFFSHRGSGGKTGRMAALLMLNEK